MPQTERPPGPTLPTDPLAVAARLAGADLVASVEGADGRSYVGIVVETKDEGEGAQVTVDFPSREVLALRVGRRTSLVFSGGGLPAPLQVEGQVVLRAEDAVRFRYAFHFPDRKDLTGVLSRRRAVRVRPRSDSPVDVLMRVSGSKTVHQAVLQDISVSGASVLVTRELEEDFFASWKVYLTLHLEGQEAPLEVAGIIRYRKLSGFVVRYGIEFDQGQDGFQKIRPRLQDYVAGRLSEELERLNPQA